MDIRSSCGVSATTRKRKFQEEDSNGGLRLDELNQDLLERILSWLPTSTFFRLSSVCKRWKSVASSASFTAACSVVPTRDPWFLMVGPPSHAAARPVVLHSTDLTWRQLNHSTAVDAVPVASAGGLVCYRGQNGHFTVCNPVTGSTRRIPDIPVNGPLHAVVMQPVDHHSFSLILVYGELPFLSSKLFDSNLNQWEDDTSLARTTSSIDSYDGHDGDDNTTAGATVYFLSKAGNVVATNMLRSPTKQYSSVLTVNGEGDNLVHFLSSSGTVVSCNLEKKSFTEYPRLLPVYTEYSIDIIEIGGEMTVVALAEFLETASLRMWRFDDVAKSWCHVSAMPPSMSHEFYGKKVDINCVGGKNLVLICLSSIDICRYILYNVVEDEWIELPKCCVGEGMEFMSAFSFEPRIEACV